MCSISFSFQFQTSRCKLIDVNGVKRDDNNLLFFETKFYIEIMIISNAFNVGDRGRRLFALCDCDLKTKQKKSKWLVQEN